MNVYLETKFFKRKGWTRECYNLVWIYTYQGKRQRLTISYMPYTIFGGTADRFFMNGLNGYDKMEVKTVDMLPFIARIMGYDVDIIEELNRIEERETRCILWF